MSSSSYVRPKVRKSKSNKSNTKSTGASSSSTDDSTKDLEQKMQSWMGLQSMSPSLSTKEQEQNQQGEGEATKKPASILKTPKYSSTASTSTIEQKPVTGRQSTPVVCGDIIERDPYRPIQKMDRQKRREQVSHSVVEGYEPMSSIASPNEETSSAGGGAAGNATKTNHQVKFTTTTTTTTPSKEKDDSNMVILSSLEEMFEAAGENLPEDRTTITPDTKLVEADLSFSVMTQEQYGEKMTEIKREMEDERQDMYKMFLGSDNVFDGECSSAASDDDSDDDDEFLEFLMETENYESDDEEVEEAQPRAFSLVWNVLSLWLTPEAVEWMARLEGPGESSDTPAFYNNERTLQVDKSDIGASRCAGLMAMIKMYLPSSMKELKYPDDMRRIAEMRLGDFLRTFDYSREAPKLGVKMWKAITCILLDLVMIESRREASVATVPPAVSAVEMTIDEYRYLTRSAVQTFQAVR